MKTLSSSRWIVALLFINLGLGVVIGILIDQHLLTPAEATTDESTPDQPMDSKRGHSMRKPPRHQKETILKKLSGELQLNDEQFASLSAMFDSHHQLERESHRNHFQSMSERRKQFMTEVESVLTPEQTERFREIRRRIDEKRMEMRRQRGMFGPGRGPGDERRERSDFRSPQDRPITE